MYPALLSIWNCSKIRKKMGCWTYYFCPCFRDKWDSMFPPPEEKKEVTDKEKRAAARKAKQEEALAEVNRCDCLSHFPYAK